MSDKKTVIALGYFDSVHKGHRLVMETARRFAKQNDADFVVFTFGGNLKAMLLGEQEKYVYSPIEREKMIKEKRRRIVKTMCKFTKRHIKLQKVP